MNSRYHCSWEIRDDVRSQVIGSVLTLGLWLGAACSTGEYETPLVPLTAERQATAKPARRDRAKAQWR